MRREAAAAGLGAGEVAAIALTSGADLLTALLAIAGIGAAAPLNPSFTESEFRYLLNRLNPRVVVVPEGLDSPAATAAEALHIPAPRNAFAGNLYCHRPSQQRGRAACSLNRCSTASVHFSNHWQP